MLFLPWNPYLWGSLGSDLIIEICFHRRQRWEFQGVLRVVAFFVEFLAGKWRKSVSKARVSLVFD